MSENQETPVDGQGAAGGSGMIKIVILVALVVGLVASVIYSKSRSAALTPKGLPTSVAPGAKKTGNAEDQIHKGAKMGRMLLNNAIKKDKEKGDAAPAPAEAPAAAPAADAPAAAPAADAPAK